MIADNLWIPPQDGTDSHNVLLTSVATILNLAEQGLLHKLDAGLSWREQEERLIYVLPQAKDWMLSALPDEVSNWQLELTPNEQLAAFLIDYCAGNELTYERQFQPIRHISEGIWELKTADLRLFGWFYRKDIFICASGDVAWRIKELSLYSAYRDEAVRRRDALDLDGPKFVPGDNPDDVISTFCFP